MNQAMLRVNSIVRRCEGAGLAVLGLCAVLAPWLGVEAPMSGPVGSGLELLDAVVTGSILAAAVAQIARIIQAPADEHITLRIAAWLLLLSLLMISGRLVWILATVGDVHMTATMALALFLLAFSVLLHAAGRVIYGGAM